MSTLKVNTIQNTSGVEVYTCKAWVNFNGTGTVAIRAAGNVSSITDSGTGIYTVNFTTAMIDSNYSTVVTCQQAEFAGMDLPSTNSVNAYVVTRADSLSRVDNIYVNVVVFR